VRSLKVPPPGLQTLQRSDLFTRIDAHRGSNQRGRVAPRLDSALRYGFPRAGQVRSVDFASADDYCGLLRASIAGRARGKGTL
jgi:hypothetical protein